MSLKTAANLTNNLGILQVTTWLEYNANNTNNKKNNSAY